MGNEDAVCPTYVGMNRGWRWGCRGWGVCPTYVGMNRDMYCVFQVHYGMPHVCGDEPLKHGTAAYGVLYAPRMWG